MRNPNEEATMEVDWLLQESYKRATKLRGIGDWSDFESVEAKDKAEREVEQYQLEIAKLISSTLIEKQRELASIERNKKWDEQDAKFEKRQEEFDEKFDAKYGINKKEDIGFRKDKDEVDDRGTDDIGKV